MFPAILVFGDSTIDTGNNNYIKTYIRANFPPYGCNFPGHNATGRFSNGKLIPDFIASLMGIKDTVPPFLDPHLSDSDIITGVCFASAGSGYDNLTDRATSTLSVDKQADMLRSYVERLSQIVGDEKAASIVSEALVIVSSGTNDFNLNLYDTPSRRQKLGVDGYQSFILSNVHNFVQVNNPIKPYIWFLIIELFYFILISFPYFGFDNVNFVLLMYIIIGTI